MAIKERTRRTLESIDPDFSTRRTGVQLILAAAVDHRFPIEEGRIVVEGAGSGMSLARQKFLGKCENLRKRGKATLEDLKLVPWNLFEKTDRERQTLKKRMQMRLSPSEELWGGIKPSRSQMLESEIEAINKRRRGQDRLQ